MNRGQLPYPSNHERNVRIVPLTAEEQKPKIDGAVAPRAYQIFQKRGGTGWQEWEDWRNAEAELRSRVCVGITTEDQVVFVGTDVTWFEPGTIEVGVAPRPLTMSRRNRRAVQIPPRPARTWQDPWSSARFHCLSQSKAWERKQNTGEEFWRSSCLRQKPRRKHEPQMR